MSKIFFQVADKLKDDFAVVVITLEGCNCKLASVSFF